MATISASPRVAPLRWVHLPVVGVGRRPVVADTVSVRQETSADVINWRLIGWIVAVFLGTLAFSGALAQGFAAAPSEAMTSVQGPAGPPETAAHPAYTVAAGDTLWGIARQVAPASDPRATLGEIRSLNGLSNGHVLQAGEVLMLPASP
jgi:LysM repeat protein